ncbi:MAG: hypothetical protein HOB73_06670 [Planctomycetaceae bacterium]|jgi:hypothetical protein|nr:hypothetical protein [Planctomycetaceae bacterium]
MSLFDDPNYRWRDTFIVLFNDVQRPTIELALSAIQKIGKFEVQNSTESEFGHIESITITSNVDLVGLEILYVAGDEVVEETEALVIELAEDAMLLGNEDSLTQLSAATARFDILHFEQITGNTSEPSDDDELMDPGSLLTVTAALADLVSGVAVDPSSASFV